MKTISEIKSKELKNVMSLCVGLKGSGKTQLAKYIADKKFRRPIGIRVSSDFDNLDNITLIEGQYHNLAGQLEKLAKYLCLEGRKIESEKRPELKIPYDCLVIDEADLFFINRGDIGQYTNELFQKQRHYGIAIITITRRPQDIPAFVREGCEHNFIFLILGSNVERVLNALHQDLFPLVRELKKNEHKCVYYRQGENPMIMVKVPMID